MVTVTVNTARDIEQILTALRDHPRLALLTSPASRIPFLIGQGKVRLENAIINGLEGFAQLECLVIEPNLYHMSDLIAEAIDRLPRLQASPNTTLPLSANREAAISRYFTDTL